MPGPHKRRSDIKLRIAHLLRMILNNDDNPKGISAKTAAGFFDLSATAIGMRVDDATGTLRNYLRGERAPEPGHAWALGEGLRQAGVTWMNGYSMLWATGAYEHALATIFEFVASNKNTLSAQQSETLWLGAVTGVRVPEIQSRFDFDSSLVERFRKGVALDSETESLLRNIAKPNDEAAQLEIDKFTDREFAKVIWLEVVPYATALVEAFRVASDNIWFEMEGKKRISHHYAPRMGEVDFWGQHTNVDTLAFSAMDIAASSTLSLDSVEFSIFVLLGQFFNTLDPTGDGSTRSLDALPRSMIYHRAVE